MLPRFLGRGSPTTNTTEPLRGNRTHSRRAPVRFWRSSRFPGRDIGAHLAQPTPAPPTQEHEMPKTPRTSQPSIQDSETHSDTHATKSTLQHAGTPPIQHSGAHATQPALRSQTHVTQPQPTHHSETHSTQQHSGTHSTQPPIRHSETHAAQPAQRSQTHATQPTHHSQTHSTHSTHTTHSSHHSSHSSSHSSGHGRR